MERLQKKIASSGYASRRKAEELISKGKVSVNGEIVREMGYKVSDNAKIEIDGEILTNEENVYYLFYKPINIVTTTKDDKGRDTVLDFFDTDKRIFPIGRLDFDTSGLLILTNDGKLSNLISHPSTKIEKVYTAKLEGIIDPISINKLKKGLVIDDKKTSPAKAKIKSINKKNRTSIIKLAIHEGRNHQVKKMCEAVGYPVIKLKRESISFLTLEDLKPGEYRKLTPKEVHKLYAISIENKN